MIHGGLNYVNMIMIWASIFFVALFLFCFSLNLMGERPGTGSADRTRLGKRCQIACPAACQVGCVVRGSESNRCPAE